MKNFKALIAVLLTALLVAALTVPALAANYTTTETAASGTGSFTITINPSTADTATHNYAAYQLFAGDLLITKTWDDKGTAATDDDELVSTDKMLSNVTWGAGVDQTKIGTLAAALNAMKDTTTPEFTDLTATSTAREFSEAIAALSMTDDGANAQALAEAFAAVLKDTDGTSASGTGATTITGLEAGYYLVLDAANPTGDYGANTRYILEVVSDVTVNEKASVPSVDKWVLDEADDKDTASDDTDGWGETADHAINEGFQFKLVATIPTDVVLTDYSAYKVIFDDAMSAGVTFDGITSVKINDHTVATEDYTLATAAIADGGSTFTLTIDDILAPLSAAEKAAEVTVTVIYDAHLNENAVLSNADESNAAVNNNKVMLTYSNNPNTGYESMTGTTPWDSVFVFTYKVENTKYAEEAAAGNEMAGAGFTLYTNSDKTTAIKLIDNGDGTYTVADQTATTGYVTEMTSFTGTGKFDVYGLDTGSYVLAETTTPSGYNTCEDVTITITADHNENASTEGADLDVEITPAAANSIVNKSGTLLPSTGGIGTKIFIAVGALAVVAAGIVLVTNKRMKKEFD